MSTKTRIPPTEEAADQRAVLDHAFHGKPLDPDAAKRVHERAEAVRKLLPETNIAVDLIRETRDDV
jgi:hypothetical protein